MKLRQRAGVGGIWRAFASESSAELGIAFGTSFLILLIFVGIDRAQCYVGEMATMKDTCLALWLLFLVNFSTIEDGMNKWKER
jgi:hypothetical protein